jgi:transcriptional regulator with XRE-family HTH domain
MNISLRLAFFREYRNWEFEDVARELGISPESYLDLERGKAKMNGIVAQKLSDLYRAPLEFFIIDDTPHYQQADVMYTNCSFSGGYGAGYINHQYTDRGIDEILYLRKEVVH